MDTLNMPNTRRIVLLGKTGAGRSSTGNTIFGETVFTTSDSPESETSICQAKSRSVQGRSLTLIDTPGFFDTTMSEEQLRPEIVRCITECAPGPHAFLIVLEVEEFTHQEEEVVKKVSECFSAEAFRYATVLFTHGDQLEPGETIQEFVRKNQRLSDIVEKCGGRCHVIDNKRWKGKQQDQYRSNQFQVAELLRTIDKIVDNNGGYYTNEKLQEVEREIQQEEESIRQSPGNTSREEVRAKAKSSVSKKWSIKFAGFASGFLVGFLFGATAAAVVAMGAAPLVLTVGAITGVAGGVIGCKAAKGAATPREAAEKASHAVKNIGVEVMDFVKDALTPESKLGKKESRKMSSDS